MDVDPKLIEQTAPGLIGSVGAALLLKGPWPMRVGLAFVGFGLAVMTAPIVADQFEWISAKHQARVIAASGLMVGLLSMVVFVKIVETWQGLDIGGAIMEWIRKILRLSPKD